MIRVFSLDALHPKNIHHSPVPSAKRRSGSFDLSKLQNFQAWEWRLLPETGVAHVYEDMPKAWLVVRIESSFDIMAFIALIASMFSGVTMAS